MRNLNHLTKFYEKPKHEKLHLLQQAGWLSESDVLQLTTNSGLTDEIANQMVENQIGLYQLPFSVALNFLIDNQDYIIPMVTEEPSVVAAASYAAKIVQKAGGFQTEQLERCMIGQIALTHISNIQTAIQAIEAQRAFLFKIANDAYPSIVQRGGGIRNLTCEIKSYETTQFLVVYVMIDTKEAMGANMVNTILEALVPALETITGGQRLMAILSNKATASVVKATCHIPAQLLKSNTLDGETVRDKIVLASQFASADTYRATTHNKGIMNGITSVIMATGNDWRAVEAGAHAFASHSGRYLPLATWDVDLNKNLVGTIHVPLAIGTVGGSIAIHPTAQLAHRILKQPSASQLARIIAAVGLAQNFAALKALVSDGIQKGHMRLHARSLALSVGATANEADRVVKQLLQAERMDRNTALQALCDIRQT